MCVIKDVVNKVMCILYSMCVLIMFWFNYVNFRIKFIKYDIYLIIKFDELIFIKSIK